MSRLLKSAEAFRVAIVPDFRPEQDLSIETPPAESQSRADVNEKSALETENSDLRRTIEGERARNVALQAERETAFADGEAAGTARATSDEATRTERLSEALDRAGKAFDARLAALEPLAALLARKCLDKMFGHAEWRGEIVTALLAAQIERIGGKAQIRAAVSAEDFPSIDGIADTIAARFGDRVTLRADTEIASGACRLQLDFGGQDIGIDPQWTTLAATLDEIVLAESLPAGIAGGDAAA